MTGTEVLIETFVRKQLRLKAHTVTTLEENDDCMRVHIDRLGSRLLRRRCSSAEALPWKL
jgi:hypothetical protein